MARRPRLDGPDTWHHVMNRGIARRTILETDADRRFFLSLLVREVIAGRLEIHAYCLMLNHFHLLVRSLKGELSKALRRIQNRYARYFNRTRKRDGPLFRGRFLSKPVDTLRYRGNVVTYIHDNAIDAGLVSDPAAYEWSSAHHYARDRRPRWLATDWVDEQIAARGCGATGAERLASTFPTRVDEDFRRWIEKQLSERLPDELAEVSLQYAGSPRVVRWAIRKARLADGTRPFQPVCAAGVVERAVWKARRKLGPLLGRFARKAKDAWVNLRAGLLRMLAGCAHREIGLRVGRHSSTISRDLRDHALLFERDPDYAALTSRITHAAMAAMP
jgi:REP element-mobilizing transposase RayT